MAADLQNLVYQHKGPAGKVWKAEDAMTTTVTWQPGQGRVSFQHSKGGGGYFCRGGRVHFVCQENTRVWTF